MLGDKEENATQAERKFTWQDVKILWKSLKKQGDYTTFWTKLFKPQIQIASHNGWECAMEVLRGYLFAKSNLTFYLHKNFSIFLFCRKLSHTVLNPLESII